MEWNCSTAQKSPVRTALAGKTVQVKQNISTGAWSVCELTGGKKLIRRLKERHGHFADVIVADALYLNAPFINTIKECGLDAVIRLKDERRELFQDAESLFKQDEGR